MPIELSYNALTEILRMIELSEAVEKLSNQQLHDILITQVWAELEIDSPAAALISEVASRLVPDEEEPTP